MGLSMARTSDFVCCLDRNPIARSDPAKDLGDTSENVPVEQGPGSLVYFKGMRFASRSTKCYIALGATVRFYANFQNEAI